jgi:hypothetical protein
MTIFKIVLLVVVVVLLWRLNNQTSSGGGLRMSLPKGKIPSWLTFSRAIKYSIALFVLYIFYVMGSGNQFFWQPDAQVARFEVSTGTGMIYYTIPEIPLPFENKIVITDYLGVAFRGNQPAELFFPGAKLIKSGERKSEAFVRRWFSNAFLGLDHPRPEKVYEEKVTSQELKMREKIIVLNRGDELVFQERGEHIIYAQNPRLGNVMHLRFVLMK